MLPRLLYQLLPYLYIGMGLLCFLVVDSPLIFFSSALLIAAGLLVLWMRRRNSDIQVKFKPEKVRKVRASVRVTQEKSSPPDYERRTGEERGFPLIDNNGGMIAFNRRVSIG